MRDALASSGACIGCRFAAGHSVTLRYKVRHMAWGRLFGDRYNAVLVEGADSYHYRTLADYIHLNPVRARLLVPKKGQSVLDYPWSSAANVSQQLRRSDRVKTNAKRPPDMQSLLKEAWNAGM